MSVYKAKKPSNAAVALKYNPEKDYTPIVVASGHGHVAEKIINLADENGVPVYRDDSATALLTITSLSSANLIKSKKSVGLLRRIDFLLNYFLQQQHSPTGTVQPNLSSTLPH